MNKLGQEEREHLMRIVALCLSVESKGLDPFNVDVTEILGVLRKYLPYWHSFEDFNLDSEAINTISSIIKLQGSWIKHRSSSLYIDPMMIEIKLKLIEIKKLALILMKSWHPIVEMELISSKRLKEAIEYWNNLTPLEQRKDTMPATDMTLGSINIDELIKNRLISEESFEDTLKSLHVELKKKFEDKGKISYWDFIMAENYEETIYRAYLVSFLITYGYAKLNVDAIKEESFLIPNEEPVSTQVFSSISIPISIDYDSWKIHKTGV